jgi:hypothetical protein
MLKVRSKLMLFIMILALLVGALLVPINRTSSVFIPSNFENYSEKLIMLNITNPYTLKYSRTVEISCFPKDEAQLRYIFSSLRTVPHGHVLLYKEDRATSVLTIPLNDSFFKSLPSFCEVTNNRSNVVSSKLAKDLAEEEDYLRLYKELEGLTQNTSEKAFFLRKISESERGISKLKKEALMCNATSVWLHIQRNPRILGGLSTINMIWGTLSITALAGIIIFRRNKVAILLLVAIFVLSIIFLGTYVYNRIEWNERNAAINELISLSKAGEGYSMAWNSLHIEIPGLDKNEADRVRGFLEELNLSPHLVKREETPHGRCIQMYATIPKEKVEYAKKKATENGIPFYFVNETEFYSKEVLSLETENGIIERHFNELSPDAKETAKTVLRENLKELSWLKKGNGTCEVSIFVCSSVPYLEKDFIFLSHTLAKWGLVVLFIAFLVEATRHFGGLKS